MVADIEELELTDASEIISLRPGGPRSPPRQANKWNMI